MFYISPHVISIELISSVQRIKINYNRDKAVRINGANIQHSQSSSIKAIYIDI